MTRTPGPNKSPNLQLKHLHQGQRCSGTRQHPGPLSSAHVQIK
uniref:Uncharacterized protein n=1 Tax=Setaria italica TaxID=4555 RepID=K4A3T3_SETIT